MVLALTAPQSLLSFKREVFYWIILLKKSALVNNKRALSRNSRRFAGRFFQKPSAGARLN